MPLDQMESNLPASAFAVQSPQSPINYYGIEGREIYRTTFMARYTALENRVFRFDINSTVQEMENDWAALLNAAYNVLGKVAVCNSCNEAHEQENLRANCQRIFDEISLYSAYHLRQDMLNDLLDALEILEVGYSLLNEDRACRAPNTTAAATTSAQ